MLEWMEWTNQRLACPDPWMERTQRIQKRDSRGTVAPLARSRRDNRPLPARPGRWAEPAV